ncbi:cholecystokinin receptor type A-like isoform X1 [Neodiprion fabricii]|uniref:cholecystokinin receptor type A-like isoform X1 n=1 Tax=Neodiprion fabricii TaxID=2872261 RepID=UPI001ED9802B|nr:cholecystokinin receptor type A-like isoform X1 [Neodiprion fabricii]
MSSPRFSSSDLGPSIVRGIPLGQQLSLGQPSSTAITRFSTVTSTYNETVSPTVSSTGAAGGGDFLEGLIVPLYATIFVLAVIGNLLVVITLAKNKRMRTVTNVYLLNLALSDLLLGVFCIPFTLLGQMLKNFVFGTTMCRLIPYFQAVSVSVSVWTLVAISLERYFAICRPLKSRRWQTRCHACKMIAVVWAASLVWNAPILVVSSLKDISGGRQKCREDWPSIAAERAFNIFLDVILLIIPLIMMTLAYSLIVTKLRRREIQHSSSCQRQVQRTSSSATVNGTCRPNFCNETNSAKVIVTSLRQHRSLSSSEYLQGVRRTTSQGALAQDGASRKPRQVTSRRRAEAVKLWLMRGMVQIPSSGTPRVVACRSRSGTALSSSAHHRDKGIQIESENAEESENSVGEEHHDTTYTFSRHAIRSNYMDKSIEAKKKVIVMLCVVMLTFFLCWTPLYVVHTWYLFAPNMVYKIVGRTGISLIQLLAYWSSCCNPFIYCYMNRNFRQAVKSVSYECWSAYCGCGNETIGGSGSAVRNGPHHGANSEVSGNDSTIYLGRASIMARTEVVLLEAEDRV